MKQFLFNVFYWLLGVAWIAAIILILFGGARIVAWIAPWVGIVGAAGLLVGLPISLLLLIFRKTRAWGGIGIFLISWPIGLWVWLWCLIYALSVSVFWSVAGVLMGGVGVVPISGIMMIFRGDWMNLGQLIGTVAVALVLRSVGLWIVDKSESAVLISN